MMNILSKTALLWSPQIAFFTTCLYRMIALYPQSKFDRTYWKFPESPTLSLWIPILLLQTYALFYCRRQPSKIKATTFWSLLATTLAIRCLMLLSAFTTADEFVDSTDTKFLLFFSTCPLKPAMLHIYCTLRPWDWLRLGRYQQHLHEETPESKIAADIPDSHRRGRDEDQAPCSWKDMAVRLGYIHVIDNGIHVIWLRYFYDKGPYTAHVNNSELLTVMLVVLVVLFGCAQQYTHVEHHYGIEAGVAMDGDSKLGGDV